MAYINKPLIHVPYELQNIQYFDFDTVEKAII